MNLLNEEEIFTAAIQKPLTEQAEFLDRACNGNSKLRADVAALLKAYVQPDSMLNGPGVQATFAVAPRKPEDPGTLIGPYKLLEQIGEGGMGVVYVAEQTEPVRRRVALKIIKPGMDTKQVIARFEAERQALAMMDHPHIAKVLDAGTTEAGRPYFVMELVRGMPLTDYCDKVRLSPRQRLELFADVCHAIQHAHQKGIIHRDLKPSNILITLHDGKPVVKVIDFGVAKAIGQQLTERTVYTALTQLVGTPLYMSPEQAELSGLDIDTRSDVYSLGVLLYELLTGQTPFDKDRLQSVSFDEMRRMIREDEPETVSARIARTRSAERGARSEGNVPRSELRAPRLSELDWIVMKALEKDRSRRYESASALAADIQRYLSDEPVLACPRTTMYRFQKFARKHKASLTTAAAIAACLILGTTVSAWQAARATTAEAQANANEQKAVASEQTAVANAAAAEQKEQEAIKQRDEIRALADRLHRTLYASNMNLAQHAWDAGNIARVEELLDQHRPKPEETDLRGFEWHYLKRLCHADLLTLTDSSTGSASRGVAFSPDGKHVAAASVGLKVWNAQTGAELFSKKFTGSWTVAYSPDGQRIATTSNHYDEAKKNYGPHDIKVWDAHTGQELLSIPVQGTTGTVWCVAYSPDGKRLAAGTGQIDRQQNPLSGDVRVWDALTGQELLVLKGLTAPVFQVTFTPDGKRLACPTWDHATKVWDAETGQEILAIKDLAGSAFSPDGKRLAGTTYEAGGGGQLKIWDFQSGKELLSVPGRASSATFSPDGKRLASGTLKGEVHLWDAQTGMEIRTLRGHTSHVTGLAFSADGTKLVSGSRDGTVKIWDATANPESRAIDVNTDRYSRVTLSPDGKRLAALIRNLPERNKVTVWDTQTGRKLFSFEHDGQVREMIYSRDSRRLACATGSLDDTQRTYVTGAIKVWNAENGQHAFTINTSVVFGLAYSPDGKWLASGTGRWDSSKKAYDTREVKIWDAQMGNEIQSFKGHDTGDWVGVFSPDGKRLATTSDDNTVRIWDVQTKKVSVTLKAGLYCWNPEFSPDGKRLAACDTISGYGVSKVSGIKVWDLQTGQELFTLKDHTAGVQRVIFSPDGKRLVSGAGSLGGGRGLGGGDVGELKVWDAETGQQLLTLKGGGFHNGISFSPDGHWLASDVGGTPTFWDATPLPEKP